MKKIIFGKVFLVFSLLFLSACVSGHSANKDPIAFADMYMLDATQDGGMGALVGTVWFAETPEGLVIMPKFTKPLTDGEHGFHIHEGKSIAPAKNSDGKLIAGLAAKGHYDPEGTGKHEGPEGHGHLGDLPVLKIMNGKPVDEMLLAPRIKSLDDIYGRALMIHASGDNYSDEPKALGGGGARYVAGIIEKK